MSEPESPAPERTVTDDQGPARLAGHHLRVGWWAMLLFITVGIALEVLHAFKARAYLGVDQETRRLMWTLAHAHGVGLSLLHIGFGASLRVLALGVSKSIARASVLLTWGSAFIPAGFALGGLAAHAGDPGLGIVLVPIGALGLWVAVLTIALAVHRDARTNER